LISHSDCSGAPGLRLSHIGRIFFYYGFAIHGTNELSRLGGPASHGCVRLHPSHAAALFVLVQRNGPRNTRIVIN
jgi:lipoprotein-anchoring transpeptidase ErfK/SrfK